MSIKIKIYCDSGANIKFLKTYFSCIEFYQYPYDSQDRPRKHRPKVAKASNLCWKNANATWEEMQTPWKDCCGSEVYESLIKIVGKSNHEDILHLDSAYKEGCNIFLTSDKDDIWSKRCDIERICGFNIFLHKDEESVKKYIDDLLGWQ